MSNCKRILFLKESLGIGGAEKALVSLLQSFDYSNYDVTLKVICERDEFLDEVRHIAQLKLKSYSKTTGNAISRLLNQFKIKLAYKCLPAKWMGNYLCNGYDVVIAFTEGYLTKWVGESTSNCKKIAWVHTDMVDNDWPANTGIFSSEEEERTCYSRYDNVVTVSQYVEKGMRTKFKCQQVTTIYNLLDPDILEKSVAEKPKVSDDNIYAVSVGRLEKVKGYDILIESINILVKEGLKNIRVTIVGGGTEKTNLQKLITDYNLDKYITITGQKTNPYPDIYSSDLFICPSRFEGFNIAILEAMKLGKPIVSTDAIGPAEILANGEYGILCTKQPEDLAKAIKMMISDQNLDFYKTKSINRINDFSKEVQLKKLYSIL